MVVSLIFGNGGCWFGGREEEAAGGGEQDEAENEDRFAVGDSGEDLCRFVFLLFIKLFNFFELVVAGDFSFLGGSGWFV